MKPFRKKITELLFYLYSLCGLSEKLKVYIHHSSRNEESRKERNSGA
jgi:hypothetical protein